MAITPVKADDLLVLGEIARTAIIESVDLSDKLKGEVLSDTSRHLKKGISLPERVFLKFGRKDVLGFILIQDYWNLSDLYVSPKAHGQGIGRALFEAARERCIAASAPYIRANSSRNAEPFYRKLGFIDFTPEKETPDFVVPLIYNL